MDAPPYDCRPLTARKIREVREKRVGGERAGIVRTPLEQRGGLHAHL